MRKKKQPIKYTEGKIFSSLANLAWPIILANILQTAYQLIDTFWLGRLGADAVAAVSISFPILFLILSLGAGLTLAGTVIVSQYKGAENQDQVDYSSSQTVFVIFFISVLLAIVGYFSSKPLMKLIGAGPEILSDSVSYFQVSSFGFIFLFMFYVFHARYWKCTAANVYSFGNCFFELDIRSTFYFWSWTYPGIWSCRSCGCQCYYPGIICSNRLSYSF